MKANDYLNKIVEIHESRKNTYDTSVSLKEILEIDKENHGTRKFTMHNYDYDYPGDVIVATFNVEGDHILKVTYKFNEDKKMSDYSGGHNEQYTLTQILEAGPVIDIEIVENDGPDPDRFYVYVD